LDILYGTAVDARLDTYSKLSAFSDIARDILGKEIDNLQEVLETLNAHFPDQAIELD
jgi:hypothetical protein